MQAPVFRLCLSFASVYCAAVAWHGLSQVTKESAAYRDLAVIRLDSLRLRTQRYLKFFNYELRKTFWKVYGTCCQVVRGFSACKVWRAVTTKKRTQKEKTVVKRTKLVLWKERIMEKYPTLQTRERHSFVFRIDEVQRAAVTFCEAVQLVLTVEKRLFSSDARKKSSQPDRQNQLGGSFERKPGPQKTLKRLLAAWKRFSPITLRHLM